MEPESFIVEPVTAATDGMKNPAPSKTSSNESVPVQVTVYIGGVAPLFVIEAIPKVSFPISQVRVLVARLVATLFKFTSVSKLLATGST